MLREFSAKLVISYFKNLLKIKFEKNPILKPLFFTHYLTLDCNFNCIYCGFARNRQKIKVHDQLDTKDTIKLMRIIRNESPYIYITGGEPLLRNDIVDILRECKKIGFKSITINTNMSLIHQKMEVLDYLTNLVASFDVADETIYSKILGVSVGTVKQVKRNIINCAEIQKEKKFTMTVNCVITPETIQYVRDVMDFCFGHNIRFAVVPAELDDGLINDELQNNVEYRHLIKEIIHAKKNGKPIFVTQDYLETICYFKNFKCYPTLTPHIYPNGDLFYPCQPLGEIAANLLRTFSYPEALALGLNRFGDLPKCKSRCHKACYIEPSNYIERPWLFLKHLI